VLSPQHFVEVRKTPGGPSPSETTRAIAGSRLRLAEDDDWLKARIESLRGAEGELVAAAKRLQPRTAV
jgi:argininosuccinate lyase